MNMKISAAVSAALAASAVAASMQAQAAAPSLPVAAANYFPTSGSTAMNNAINEYLLLSDGNGPCAGNKLGAGGQVISVYTDGSTTYSATVAGQFAGFHQFMVVCKSAVALGSITAGQTIAISKESNGGSLEGTINVARATKLVELDPVNVASGAQPTGCTLVGTQNVGGAQAANQFSFDFYNHCTLPTTANFAPVIGWADEIPQMWSLVGARLVGPSDVAALNTTPLVQNVFGIAVSLNLYRALQKAEGKTVGDDTLANMPTLNSATVAGLYTGGISSWNNVFVAGKAITNAAYTVGHAVANSNVSLCRRGDSSGTNAFVDLFFTGNRCSQNGQTQLPATATTATTCAGLPNIPGATPEDFGCTFSIANNKNDAVFAGAGGGDVASCLDYHDSVDGFAIGNLTTNQAFNGALQNGSSTGRAIGQPGKGTGNLLAAADTTTNTHFRFVAIDGHNPSLLSVANGQYPFVEDNVLNTLNSAGAAVVALGSQITSTFGDPVNILDFDNASTQANALNSAQAADTDWTAGLLFDGFVGSPNTIPTTTATLIGAGGNPTSAFTQQIPTLNNCAPPLSQAGSIDP